jgi:hypothetical protein
LNTSKVHTVCVAGAPAEVAAHVNALLLEQRSQLDLRWQPGNHQSADLLLIDAESVHGHMDWLKAQASGRLVAACVSSPESFEAEFSLGKPIAAPDLVELLNRIGARLGALAGASVTPIRPVADKPTPAAAPIVVAAPHATVPQAVVSPPPVAVVAATPIAAPAAPAPLRLMDLLESNPRISGRLRLHVEGLPDVILDPRMRVWHSAATLKALSDWCTRTLADGDALVIGEFEFARAVASLPTQPYSRLEWLSHLLRGAGHLDVGLDANARYKLARWPQSEREFPKHFRIATMMLKSAATLEEIAELSGATVADVANFINAYHALGYIEFEAADKPQEEARRGGLFGRAKKTSAN